MHSGYSVFTAASSNDKDMKISLLDQSVIKQLAAELYRKSKYRNWYALGLCLKVPLEVSVCGCLSEA